MADKEKSEKQTEKAEPTPAKQDLPPTHPNDPTETTLTQDQAPDPDAQAEAVRKRTGEASK